MTCLSCQEGRIIYKISALSQVLMAVWHRPIHRFDTLFFMDLHTNAVACFGFCSSLTGLTHYNLALHHFSIWCSHTRHLVVLPFHVLIDRAPGVNERDISITAQDLRYITGICF